MGSTPEEELAHYKEKIVPALAKLKASLEWITTTIFERCPADAAALAALAAEEFVKNAGFARHLIAPLREAADIAAENIPAERLPSFRRGAAAVRDPDMLRRKPPPLDDFREDRGLARKDTIKIIAVLAVDLQRMLNVPLPIALKKVVGNDARAAKRLENFRDILRRTKRGAKREFYDQITRGNKGADLPVRAEVMLALYYELVGRKWKWKP